MTSPLTPLPSRLRSWRWRVFAGTWLCYVGYYFCRKNLPVVQPVLMREMGWSAVELGMVVTIYQLAYSFGQIATGVLGDRLGARPMLFLGIAATVALNVVAGFSTAVWGLAIVWGANGIAQATGWPAIVKTMAHWTRREERGRVMGWWTTNYQVGDVLGTWLTASVIGIGLSWRWAFWTPAAALVLIAIPVFRWQRNRPADVGLPEQDSVPREEGSPTGAWADIGPVFRSPAIWGISVINAALKFAMYIFFFWMPTYLVDARGYAPEMAGFLTAFHPLGGAVGAIFAGWASDRFFSSRRMPISALMIGLLAAAAVAVPLVATNAWAIGALLALIGFALYGPESILSGAAAVELAPKGGAATAAGLVNAVASLGGVPAGIVGGAMVAAYGWPAVFGLVAAVVAVSLVIAVPMWNMRGRH